MPNSTAKDVLSLSGIVVSKELVPDGQVVADGGTTANITINVAGTLMSINVPVANEINYVLGSTINFTQQ